MSSITDILLCTAIEDGGYGKTNSEVLSRWLRVRYGDKNSLKQLDDFAEMQSDVLGVAINFCDIDELIEKFKSIKWEYPESAQLMIKGEHWDCFKVFTVE